MSAYNIQPTPFRLTESPPEKIGGPPHFLVSPSVLNRIFYAESAAGHPLHVILCSVIDNADVHMLLLPLTLIHLEPLRVDHKDVSKPKGTEQHFAVCPNKAN